jgi:hypothetical protein
MFDLYDAVAGCPIFCQPDVVPKKSMKVKLD